MRPNSVKPSDIVSSKPQGDESERRYSSLLIKDEGVIVPSAQRMHTQELTYKGQSEIPTTNMAGDMTNLKTPSIDCESFSVLNQQDFEWNQGR